MSRFIQARAGHVPCRHAGRPVGSAVRLLSRMRTAVPTLVLVLLAAMACSDRTLSVTGPSLNLIPNCEDYGEYNAPPGWSASDATQMCYALNEVSGECASIGESLWNRMNEGFIETGTNAEMGTDATGSYSRMTGIIKINVEHPAFNDPFELRTTDRHEWGHTMGAGYDEDAETGTTHEELEDWALSSSCSDPSEI